MHWQKIAFRFMLFIWVGILAFLSFYNPYWLSLNPDLPWPDKYKHVLGAMILTLLINKSFPRIAFYWIIVSCTFFSFVFEWLQPVFTNGVREFSIPDIVASIIGVILGLVLIVIIKSSTTKSLIG